MKFMSRITMPTSSFSDKIDFSFFKLNKAREEEAKQKHHNSVWHRCLWLCTRSKFLPAQGPNCYAYWLAIYYASASVLSHTGTAVWGTGKGGGETTEKPWHYPRCHRRPAWNSSVRFIVAVDRHQYSMEWRFHCITVTRSCSEDRIYYYVALK